MFKVTHLTSVHPRYDTRVFIKECCSLANNGYSVSLVVADGKGDESRDGVKICDVGELKGRLNRTLKTTRRVFEKALELNADVYHLHDPELIPIGIKLKKLDKIVIFDSHEDVPKQILGKTYLNFLVRRIVSGIFATYEIKACKKFDAIVAATPFIRDKFLLINPKSIDINNFPVLGELEENNKVSLKKNQICYVGGIGKNRGIKEMVSAMGFVTCGARLQLGGSFSETEIEREVKNYKSWSRVDELGFLDRNGVKEVLKFSVLGLVTLHPQINYIDSLPVKMFEYMSAGLPVIASDFPLWRQILEKNDCGVCVDPLDPKAIAVAIDTLVNDPERAQRMGKNGKQAVLKIYNWSIEESKLLKLYESLLSESN